MAAENSFDLMKPLRNQKALVTGANSGIGEACALALAAAGAAVAVNYVSHPDDADRVVSSIQGQGGEAIAVHADVSDEKEVQAMFAEITKAFGTLDILVNNAGLQQDAPFEEMTLKQWQTVIGVNLTGQFLCAREAAREFLRRGVVPSVSSAAGKIICMSSVHEVIPWGGHVNYASSKGGVMQLMKSMAQELAPKKIRVNSVAPDVIRTPIIRSAWDTPGAHGRVARFRSLRLRHWRDPFCRWRNDALSRFRHWRLTIASREVNAARTGGFLRRSAARRSWPNDQRRRLDRGSDAGRNHLLRQPALPRSFPQNTRRRGFCAGGFCRTNRRRTDPGRESDEGF